MNDIQLYDYLMVMEVGTFVSRYTKNEKTMCFGHLPTLSTKYVDKVLKSM